MTDDWGSGNSVLRHTENRIGLISIVYQLYPSYIWDIPSFIWDILSYIRLMAHKALIRCLGPHPINFHPRLITNGVHLRQNGLGPVFYIVLLVSLVPSESSITRLHCMIFFDIVHLGSSMAILGYS